MFIHCIYSIWRYITGLRKMVFIMFKEEKSDFNDLSVITQFSKVSRCWNERLIYYFSSLCLKTAGEKVLISDLGRFLFNPQVTPGLFKVPPLSCPTNKQTWSWHFIDETSLGWSKARYSTFPSFSTNSSWPLKEISKQKRGVH